MNEKSKSQHRDHYSHRYTLKKAFLVLGCSMALVTSSFFLIKWYFSSIHAYRMNDPQYQIVALVQTGPKKEALKTVYLAELLNLSYDYPTNLYRFNSKQAEANLLANPVIKNAVIKKIKPGVIYVDYSVREPIAFLGDYSNIAIDKEGYLFPFQPFFTPKNFPEIYLGISEEENNELEKTEINWKKPLSSRRFQLALELFLLVSEECCSQVTSLKKIDVSQIDTASYGQRQIIVVFEDRYEKKKDGKTVLCVYPRIVRLNAKNYREGLQEYKLLHENLLSQEAQKEIDFSSSLYKAPAMIVDLRIPQLAFVKEG